LIITLHFTIMCKYTLFYVSLAYRSFFIGRTTLKGAKEVWRAAVPPKVKFFFWLALHGHLWTAEREGAMAFKTSRPTLFATKRTKPVTTCW
jgi:hypothetical protein